MHDTPEAPEAPPPASQPGTEVELRTLSRSVAPAADPPGARAARGDFRWLRRGVKVEYTQRRPSTASGACERHVAMVTFLHRDGSPTSPPNGRVNLTWFPSVADDPNDGARGATHVVYDPAGGSHSWRLLED